MFVRREGTLAAALVPSTAVECGAYDEAADDEGTDVPRTPDVRPVGDLPNEIGKTAARELAVNGITSLRAVANHTEAELLAIHGVGPKAIDILAVALAAQGLRYRDQ